MEEVFSLALASRLPELILFLMEEAVFALILALRPLEVAIWVVEASFLPSLLAQIAAVGEECF